MEVCRGGVGGMGGMGGMGQGGTCGLVSGLNLGWALVLPAGPPEPPPFPNLCPFPPLSRECVPSPRPPFHRSDHPGPPPPHLAIMPTMLDIDLVTMAILACVSSRLTTASRREDSFM